MSAISDPQDAQVARQYQQDRETFNKTAMFWTRTYATESSDEEVIERLVGMGFEKEKVVKALDECGGDESGAVEKLISGA